MNQNQIVLNMPMWNKCILIMRNQLLHNGLKSSRHDFWDYFIAHITKTDGQYFLMLFGASSLGIKTMKVLFINFRIYPLVKKDLTIQFTSDLMVCQYFWKMSAVNPSCLGAFEPPILLTASHISFSSSILHKILFSASEIISGISSSKLRGCYYRI